MAGPSHLKPIHSLHIFSMKSPSSSPSPSTLSSMKLKTLVQTFILSHLCHVTRTLTQAKSLLVEVLKEMQVLIHLIQPKKRQRHKNNKLFFGSFRLHYNWCSSNVLPVPSPWNSIISPGCDDINMEESQLSGYLKWLEHKVQEESKTNEIDKLADLFIANCHEKFKLEKQESYRMFQEMMARSV